MNKRLMRSIFAVAMILCVIFAYSGFALADGEGAAGYCTYPVDETCFYCFGNKTVTCPDCKAEEGVTCEKCNSTGEIECATCNGTGLVQGVCGDRAISSTDTATCQADGTLTTVCESKGHTVTVESPKKDHTPGNDLVEVPATCKESGSKTFTCIYCNEVINETYDALGHTPVEGSVVETAATCTAAGSKVYTCATCNEEITEEIPATGQHNYVNGVCTVCGAAESTPVTPVTPTNPEDPSGDDPEEELPDYDLPVIDDMFGGTGIKTEHDPKPEPPATDNTPATNGGGTTVNTNTGDMFFTLGGTAPVVTADEKEAKVEEQPAGEVMIEDEDTPLANIDLGEEESNGFPWWIIAVAVVVLGGLFFIIGKRRREEEN